MSSLFDRLFSTNDPNAVPLREPILSKEEFARLILSKIKEIQTDLDVSYDPKDFLLKVPAPNEKIMYLGNAYAEYTRSNEQDHPIVLKKWLRHFLFLKELPADFEDVIPDLFPALRARTYFEMLGLHFQDKKKGPPTIPYLDVGDHFGLAVAYDMYDSIILISEQHLKDWGISFFEIMEIANRNLLERESRFACLSLENKTKVYVSASEDGFDSSRLMMTDFIRDLELIGDPIALCLSPDRLLITGSEDTLGLCVLAAQVIDNQKQPRAFPPLLLRLLGEEWCSWFPPKNDQTYIIFRQLAKMDSMSLYNIQHQFLQDTFQQTDGGTTLFAPILPRVLENPDDMIVYTFWRSDCTQLLPQTDYISFIEAEIARETPLIPWSIVEETVGHLLKPQNVYPIRYLVSEFPTGEELADMLAAWQD